jgi:ADP-ribosylglycohydrolase
VLFILAHKQKGLLYGTLIADALALGPHWVYDTQVIKDNFSNLNVYTDPYAPYHEGKTKGDFTHYGDQTLHLLEFIASNKGFDINTYKNEWIKFASTHQMYKDHATKSSLEVLGDAKVVTGSSSDELGGFVRSAPLFLIDYVSMEDVVSQTALTHNNSQLNEIVEFTFLVIKRILSGYSPKQSLGLVYVKSSPSIKKAYDLAKSLLDEPSTIAIDSIGQSCSSSYGFPAALYLILKYEEDMRKALEANCYAGGDSAARGMYVGMILGAHHGLEAIDQSLIDSLNASKRIHDAINLLESK